MSSIGFAAGGRIDAMLWNVKDVAKVSEGCGLSTQETADAVASFKAISWPQIESIAPLAVSDGPTVD